LIRFTGSFQTITFQGSVTPVSSSTAISGSTSTAHVMDMDHILGMINRPRVPLTTVQRSEEHTSELQSRFDLVCRLLLEKKNQNIRRYTYERRIVQLLYA